MTPVPGQPRSTTATISHPHPADPERTAAGARNATRFAALTNAGLPAVAEPIVKDTIPLSSGSVARFRPRTRSGSAVASRRY